jgi:UDP-N-acetylglucosamine:LPS N-acetylglucosamine transferase
MATDGRPTAEGRFELFAAASFGGHFEQLLQLREAWGGRACLYITTREGMVEELADAPIAVVKDCHTGQVVRATLCLMQLCALFFKHRPRYLVTTGALPGLLATVAARLVGARVIWIDSVANSERLSTSGRHAKRFAHAHYSQWPEVAERQRTDYAGSLF